MKKITIVWAFVLLTALFLQVLPAGTFAADSKLRFITKFEYDMAEPFNNGAARVEKDGKVGYIDKTGKAIIPVAYTAYTEIGEFGDGLVPVKRDGKFGFLDVKGLPSLPFIYEEAGSFSEGLAAVKKDGLWGYINTKGNTVLPFAYNYAGSFQGGVAGVDSEKLFGTQEEQGYFGGFKDGKPYSLLRFIDKKGTVVFVQDGNKYMWPSDFRDGISTFYSINIEQGSTLMGVMDATGKVIVAPDKYKTIMKADNGFCMVKPVKGQWGLLDSKGVEILPCIYTALQLHSDYKRIEVSKSSNDFGLCNLEGKFVVSLKKANGYYVGGGIWHIWDNSGKTQQDYYVDKDGKRINASKFDLLIQGGGFAWVKEAVEGTGDFRYGIVNTQYKLVVPFSNEIDEPLTGFREGAAIVQKKDKRAYVLAPANTPATPKAN
jgi:hypothetical protein